MLFRSAYTTENYAYHAGLMIYTLQLMNRTNQMSDIVMNDAEIIDMLDSPDDGQDTVTIKIVPVLKTK